MVDLKQTTLIPISIGVKDIRSPIWEIVPHKNATLWELLQRLPKESYPSWDDVIEHFLMNIGNIQSRVGEHQKTYILPFGWMYAGHRPSTRESYKLAQIVSLIKVVGKKTKKIELTTIGAFSVRDTIATEDLPGRYSILVNSETPELIEPQ